MASKKTFGWYTPEKAIVLFTVKKLNPKSNTSEKRSAIHIPVCPAIFPNPKAQAIKIPVAVIRFFRNFFSKK